MRMPVATTIEAIVSNKHSRTLLMCSRGRSFPGTSMSAGGALSSITYSDCLSPEAFGDLDIGCLKGRTGQGDHIRLSLGLDL